MKKEFVLNELDLSKVYEMDLAFKAIRSCNTMEELENIMLSSVRRHRYTAEQFVTTKKCMDLIDLLQFDEEIAHIRKMIRDAKDKKQAAIETAAFIEFQISR